MPVTQQQAQMLASLAVACRPYGAPTWDEAGVLAQVAKVKDRALPEVIMAVTRAAADRAAITPGVISAVGSQHWAEKVAPPTAAAREPYDPTKVCGVCGKREDRCHAVSAAVSDHEFTSAVITKRQAATGSLREREEAS